MKKKGLLIALVTAGSLVMISGAVQAAGCAKGAMVGAAAGHVAGRHAVLGAIAGCAVGHHLAKTQAKEAAAPTSHSK